MKKGSRASEETRKKLSLAHKGKKRTSFSEEWKKKLSEVHKRLGTKPPSFGGKHHSPESKKKISLAHLGKKYKPMSAEGRKNIGLAGIGRKHTDEWKKRMSLIISRRKLSDETRNKISVANKGRIFSDEHRKHLSKSHIGKNIGQNHPSWRGGITPLNHKIRTSLEYKFWRKSVFSRDNFICQKCKQRGGILRSHHINNFADFPELRVAIDNGCTLCEKCHKEFHKRYGNRNNTRGQLEEYLNIL